MPPPMIWPAVRPTAAVAQFPRWQCDSLCGDVTTIPFPRHHYDVWHDHAVFPLPHRSERESCVCRSGDARASNLRIAATGRHGLALSARACTDVQDSSMRHEMCPFYRTTRVPAVERRRMPRDGRGSPPPLDAAWCAHLFTPVTRFAATTVAGGWGKLRCNGDLGRCEVLPSKR